MLPEKPNFNLTKISVMPNQPTTLSRGRQQLVRTLCLFACSLTCFNAIHSQEVFQVQSGASVQVEKGAAITIYGGILLESGSMLVNNGTIQLNKGNWTDHSLKPYYYGTGKTIFNGSAGHKISTNNIFEQIEINSQEHVSLASDVNSHNWYLINGRVITGDNRAIVKNNSSMAIVADASNIDFSNSWFYGNLRRYIDPVADYTYTFPVGDAINVKCLLLFNFSSGNRPGYIDAAFGEGPVHDAGLLIPENGQAYRTIHHAGSWNLVPDNEINNGTYDLRVYVDGFSGLQDNAFGVLGRSHRATNWSVPAGSILPAADLPGRIVSSGFAERKNISGYGQFGIGLLTSPVPFVKTERQTGAEKVSVVLFPNPNNGQFSLRLDAVGKTYDAFITDMNGKMIRQLKLANNNNVRISGLSAGTYIISIPNVFGQGQSFSERVIVIR
jgi:Secretion system C-terminal sorting domain